jgi:hypothetical protein
LKDIETKIDGIEARLIRKNIEFKKIISDLQYRSEELYSQNLQIKESIDIE